MTSLKLPHLGSKPALRRRRQDAGIDTVRVRVHGGYEPRVIHARARVPLRIVFRREESAACSEQVVFPALGTSATLPLLKDVAIEIVPPAPGEYEFTCAMGMLRGRLVVTDGELR